MREYLFIFTEEGDLALLDCTYLDEIGYPSKIDYETGDAMEGYPDDALVIVFDGTPNWYNSVGKYV